MIDKLQQVQLKKLLSEAVLLLCRNGLPIDAQFSIEAMIGITMNEDEVFLISFRETVAPTSTEKSCELLLKEHADKITKYSHSGRNSRENESSSWTSSSADFCKPAQQMENMEDTDNPDKEMDEGFSYDSGLRSFGHGVIVKSEVDHYVTEFSSDFGAQSTDEVCKNREFESEVKSESDGYGFESFERSAHDTDTNSSQPVIVDTTSVVSLYRKPVSSQSSYWLPLNHKVRTRKQTLQRSTGSRYSASSDQRQKGPVYLESAESLASVEKILSAIYPPTDNQSLRCHVCGAALKCRRTLMEHIRGTHLSIHSYHCPDCGLGFKWRSSLKHHRARNCTLPSVLAAAYDCRPPVGGRDPLQWTDNY